MTARFPRTARVRTGKQFEAVFKGGRRTASPLLAMHWLANDVEARLGLAVSRKVSPHAVLRNGIKRLLRDEFRKLRMQLPPGDYVLVARPGAATCPNPVLRATFNSLLLRAGALPPAAPDGTMPPAPPPACAPDIPGR